VDKEESRLSGLVNCSLVTDYMLRYCSSMQVADSPTMGCPAVFGELLIAFNCSLLSF
jgi:hypothetical protein